MMHYISKHKQFSYLLAGLQAEIVLENYSKIVGLLYKETNTHILLAPRVELGQLALSRKLIINTENEVSLCNSLLGHVYVCLC